MTEKSDVHQTIERELARLVRALEAVRQPAGASAAMDRAAYLLLDQLAMRPRSVGELASELHLDQSTVTRQVTALVGRGLAHRVQDPAGGRAALLEITGDGQRQLAAEQSSRAARVNRMLTTWSDQDRDELARLLVQLNAALDDRLRTKPPDGSRP